MPESSESGDGGAVAAYPQFVSLSRRPALKTKTTTDDPTLRDEMSNGMVTTRAKFTRQRRAWTVTIENLHPNDIARLDEFVRNTAVFGAAIFLFPDNRDPRNPQQYTVRFSKIPEYTDVGWVDNANRQNTTFELKEV